MVLTKAETWRPVVKLTRRAYDGSMIDMGGRELSTPTHQVWYDGAWRDMAVVLPSALVVPFSGDIYNLHIAADNEDEQSYTLDNGLIVHNVLTISPD